MPRWEKRAPKKYRSEPFYCEAKADGKPEEASPSGGNEVSDPDNDKEYLGDVKTVKKIVALMSSLDGDANEEEEEEVPSDQIARAWKAAKKETQSFNKEPRAAALKTDAAQCKKNVCDSSLAVPDDRNMKSIYREVGVFLAKYRRGRLPKFFNVLPKCNSWKEALLETSPSKWSSKAMFQATKLFVAHTDSGTTRTFFTSILLPVVREGMKRNKKLDRYYYESLCKAFFKPAEWFQGILFPLVLDGCTLHEAVIFGSVIAKVSIPMLHAAAALMRLCSFRNEQSSPPNKWEPPVSYFINVLVTKKYALPKACLSELVNHFLSFATASVQMPVVWYEALLSFVERYKHDFSVEESCKLRELLKVQNHPLMSVEIQRQMSYGDYLRMAVD